jgi:hypothetical protein
MAPKVVARTSRTLRWQQDDACVGGTTEADAP